MTHAPKFWAAKLPEHLRGEFWGLIEQGFGGETAYYIVLDIPRGRREFVGLGPSPKKNPRGGKFDRCVAEVSRSRSGKNPYAVCASALKARRRKNPRGFAARHWFRLIARRGDTRLVYVGANKFSRHGQPLYFPTMKAAEATARWLVRQFPGALRGFTFHAVEN